MSGMKKTGIFLVVSIIFFPTIVLAQVLINEVAWMGNSLSANCEWLELYNKSLVPVDLTNWSLYEGRGDTLIINLTESIASGGYYLIERSVPTCQDPVPGLENITGSFGGSGLSNSGEYLVLKDGVGDAIDSLDASSKWPAGNITTRETMQWNGSTWITGAATPKAKNVGVSDPTPSGNSGPVQGAFATAVTSASQTTPVVSESEEQTGDFSIQIGKARSGVVGVPIYFNADVSPRSVEDKVSYSWSFGDGTTAFGSVVRHIYAYPGKYFVVARAQKGTEFALAKILVNVLESELEISEIIPGSNGHITLVNKSPQEIDLYNFSLNLGSQIFRFPQDMIVFGESSVRFSNKISGIWATPGDIIEFRNPYGEIIHSLVLPNNQNVQEEILAKVVVVPEHVTQDIQPFAVGEIKTEQINIGRVKNEAVPVKVISEVPKTIVITRKFNLLEKILALPRNIISSVFAVF